MFKIRFISAIIGFLLLLLVIWMGQIALGLIIALLSIIGLSEFYNAVSKVGFKPLRPVGYLACLPLIYMGFTGLLDTGGVINPFKLFNLLSLGIFAAILVMFTLAVLSNNWFNIVDLSLTIMGIAYVPLLFSFIILTRNFENGSYYIWLIFIGAWATDTFAYLFGRAIGKKKFLAISPNKTIEGAIGGIAGCVVLLLLYGTYLNYMSINIRIYHFLILGLLCGAISQLGDLAASLVKRYTGIKDYGHVMPGHGGVLDRFDSILFTAPVVYFYIVFII